MTKLYKGVIAYHSTGGSISDANIAVGHMSWEEYNALPDSQNEHMIPLANLSLARHQRIEFDLYEREFDEIKSGDRKIFLWAMPAASCSLKTPTIDKYSGLVGIDLSTVSFIRYSAAKEGYSGEVRTKGNSIHVRESAIAWTANTMTANLTSSAANEIRSEPLGGTGNKIPDHGTKEATMAAMGHPDDSFEQTKWSSVPNTIITVGGALLLDDKGPWQGGSWDLKPRIYAVWGSRLRLGNENWVLSYDHLSNVHYGYIAAATGFSLQNAIELADMRIPGMGSSEDPGDEWATVIGASLYKAYPNGITPHQLWQELKRHRGKTRPTTFASPSTRHALWTVSKLRKRHF